MDEFNRAIVTRFSKRVKSYKAWLQKLGANPQVNDDKNAFKGIQRRRLISTFK